MPDFETIRLDVDAGVATLTLDRPDRLNAFTGAMAKEILAAFDRIDADDDIRAVVVTGAGRAFCAGADLSEGADTFNAAARGITSVEGRARRDTGGVVTLRIFECLKPVIAAINGHAVGVGASMTLPMDVRLIAEDAKMGFVFAARGIVPDGAASWFLPRVVGISQALEWCLTGRVFPAAEALAGGLVAAVVPGAELLPRARALAAEMAANVGPVSAAITRQLLWRMQAADHPMVAHRVDSQAIAETGAMADAAEGVMAFLEKRPASWTLKVSRDLPGVFPWWDEPSY
ncbi:MAG: enoyl-CoA hydratase-related protein [Actinomycetota bacterium]|nr:enoyl-CoA hydratase-related protein [Actinomycetota bacterium]